MPQPAPTAADPETKSAAHVVRPSRSPAAHQAALDGLRALACLAVFGVHFHQISRVEATVAVPGWERWLSFDLGRFLENGNTGVALFFLLSGLHLSEPWWQGRIAAAPTAWLGRYVRGRMLRIVPAYYLCLSVLVWYQRKFQSASELFDAGVHYLGWHTWWEATFYSINNPFWTIGVQIQFYWLLPLVLLPTAWLARRRGVAAALVIGSYLAHLALMERGDRWCLAAGLSPWVAEHPTVASHSLLAHLPIFFLGLLAAGLAPWVATTRQSTARAHLADGLVLSLLGATALLLATPLGDLATWPHGRYHWPTVPLALAVVVLLLPRARRATAVLGSYPLRTLGAISYGVYLFHLPCQRLVEKLLEQQGSSPGAAWALFGAASFLLTMVLAAVSYVLIERPLLARLGGRPMASLWPTRGAA